MLQSGVRYLPRVTDRCAAQRGGRVAPFRGFSWQANAEKATGCTPTMQFEGGVKDRPGTSEEVLDGSGLGLQPKRSGEGLR
jgi:hypothetical protein